MGNAFKGTFAAVLEATPGKQLLLAQTLITATMSLTNQPSGGSTGYRISFSVQGNTAIGSITFTGKDINGNALVETISNIPVQNVLSQNPAVNDFEWNTVNVFSSINANGITTTGLTGGFITIYATQAPKILIPSEVDIDPKYDSESPKEHRGLVYLETNVQQTIKQADFTIKQALYPENSLIVPYAVTSNNPTIATIPGTPTVLKASALISGTYNLTTQPTAPGQVLQFVITGAGGAGTIVLSGGVNSAGQTITTETIIASGNGNFYSSNSYSNVANAITFTGLTGASMATNGLFAFDYQFLPNGSIYTLCGEDFSGTDTATVPMMVITDFELSQDVKKAVDITYKGFAQDHLPIGDRTTANMTVTRALQLGQPLDKPFTGWQSQIFIDPVPALGGTPGTTAFGDMNTFKFSLKLPAEAEFNATNSQLMTGFYQDQISATFSMSINFKNLLQYEQFRTNGKQIFVIKYLGQLLGTNGGVLVQKAFILYVAAKYKAIKRKRDKKVTADLEATMEYEPSLGYGYKIEVITIQPPTLPN